MVNNSLKNEIVVEIMTTTYTDGVPADQYANGYFLELLDEYSDFFKGTELEDVYFVIDGGQSPKADDGTYNRDGVINDMYYFNKVLFWQRIENEYQKLISYKYTIEDNGRYTGTARVLAHDGTEHIEEFTTSIETAYIDN